MDFQSILNQSNSKPQKILKIVISISAAMLVMWLVLVSQIDTGNISQSEQVEVQERTEGLRQSLQKPKDQTGSPTVEKKEAPDMFNNAFVTFLVMIGILGIVWVWARKKGGQMVTREKTREIGEHILGQGSQLKFLEINNEVWVLALSAGSVSLLHRVPKSEWKEEETQQLADSNILPKGSSKSDFKSIYKYFSN